MKKDKFQPPLTRKESDLKINNKDIGIDRIFEIITRLTDKKNGCPWDQIQTNLSLAQHTVEEAYEVAEAIELQLPDELCNELGDLLFNVLFHIHIASETGRFNFADVIDGTVKKMVSRHPHVFKYQSAKTLSEVNEQWDEIKRTERNISATEKISAELDKITKNIPALTKSVKIQKKVAKIGLEWETSVEIINKIYEEIDEFVDEDEKKNEIGKLNELGDILFSVVNLARYHKIDPETALRSTNRKFIKRVMSMETKLNQAGKEIKNTARRELDLIWQMVKREQ